MARVILIVIDALGVGAMPDAAAFGDGPDCNTLGNVARACGGLRLPCLGRMGLGRITQVEGVPAEPTPIASWGLMMERSLGKDTTTGHWELAGILLDEPFQVYPNGFPVEMLSRFMADTGCEGILGNRPASGTEIIEILDAEHRRTGWPIVYTSADSVFQIACNIDVVPLERQYQWCRIARCILDDGYRVSRVIARPYQLTNGYLGRLSAARHDYSVPPPRGSMLDRLRTDGVRVVGVGKIADIFLQQGITHSVPTASNSDGLERVRQIVAGNLDLGPCQTDREWSGEIGRELVFANLVDTDMLYGHRNDWRGFGDALEEIDAALGQILSMLGPDDMLMITGDHGCDPTQPGTDHTREMVPLLRFSPSEQAIDLGLKRSFTHVAHATSKWLGVVPDSAWAP